MSSGVWTAQLWGIALSLRFFDRRASDPPSFSFLLVFRRYGEEAEKGKRGGWNVRAWQGAELEPVLLRMVYQNGALVWPTTITKRAGPAHYTSFCLLLDFYPLIFCYFWSDFLKKAMHNAEYANNFLVYVQEFKTCKKLIDILGNTLSRSLAICTLNTTASNLSALLSWKKGKGEKKLT